MSDQQAHLAQDAQPIPVTQSSDQQTSSSDTNMDDHSLLSSDNNESVDESALPTNTESLPNRQTDSVNDESTSNQHIGDSTSGHPLSDQSNQLSIESSAPQGQTDVVADNEEEEDEEDDEDEDDEVDTSWFTHVEHPFAPESVSDVTLHYDCSHTYARASYHLHRLTLITMSKYFDVALVDAQDSTPSTCTRTDRCKLPGHRCLEIGNNEIGGRSFTHHDLNEFFRHLYSIADGSGHWKEIIENESNRT